MTRQVHLGLFLAGVGPQLVWDHPDAAPHTAIETFVEVAQLLERGLFDAFFLGEGLRVRENRGRVFDLDVAGRPDAITQLAVLAGVTEKIGLVATQNTTYNYPADLARRLASLDAVSGGRAGWNVVTTDNAWTGENFRHGGRLPHALRYDRAGQVVESAAALWANEGTVRRSSDLVAFTADPTVPPSPQQRPVLFQAGDSTGGRELAARWADAVFTAHTTYEPARAYAEDLRARLARHGRGPDAVRILPGASVVLGDTAADARDKARWLREAQVTGPRALAYLEQYWGTDLSAYDPEGPLPDIEPVEGELDPSRGTISIDRRSGKAELVAGWRELAEAKDLSLRQLVIEVSAGHPAFVGTASSVADEWAELVGSGVVDGFNLLPWLVPGSITDVVDELVPQLQDRGVYRTAYTGSTLREHLDLPPVVGPAAG